MDGNGSADASVYTGSDSGGIIFTRSGTFVEYADDSHSSDCLSGGRKFLGPQAI